MHCRLMTLRDGLQSKLSSLKNAFSRSDASSSGESERKARRIVRDSKDRIWLMLPFVLWVGAMVGIYTASEEMLVMLPGLLSELNGINYCIYGIDRCTFLAHVRATASLLAVVVGPTCGKQCARTNLCRYMLFGNGLRSLCTGSPVLTPVCFAC